MPASAPGRSPSVTVNCSATSPSRSPTCFFFFAFVGGREIGGLKLVDEPAPLEEREPFLRGRLVVLRGDRAYAVEQRARREGKRHGASRVHGRIRHEPVVEPQVLVG